MARDQVEPTFEPDPVQSLGRGSVTSLELGFWGWDDGARVMTFLGLVGLPLTRLRLQCDASAPVDFLFRYCPNLESLAVFGPEVSTDLFLAAYRASAANLLEVDCCFDDLPKLVAELANSTSHLIQTLKRLMRTTNADGGDAERDQVDAMAETLKVNQTLELLFVSATRHLPRGSECDQLRHHKEDIAGAKGPFPLKCRLAFVSVFGAHCARANQPTNRVKPDSHSTALVGLAIDRNVLSIIFVFAAERARRRVYVEYDH